MSVSRGLANKMIVPKLVKKTCLHCSGTGTKVLARLEPNSIKNLQVSGGLVLENDCPHCNGQGETSSVIRVVRKIKQ